MTRITRRLPVVPGLLLTAMLAACGQVSTTPTTQTPASDVTAQFVPGEVLVQFDSSLSAQSIGTLEASLGIQAVEKLAVTDGAPLYLARVTDGRSTEQAIAALEKQGGVRFAEPNWIYTHAATSNDPQYTNGTLWGMQGNFGSAADAAWTAGKTGSKSVYIGVIDEGIDVSHPDLQANIWTNPYDPVDGVDNDGNGYVDDKHGYDFANGNNSVFDGNKREGTDEHGTHVAGTIGGVGGNGIGVAGVNWSVTMISGKFLGSRGGTTANAIKAVDYFTTLKTKHGLNIVATNNSWGGGGFSQGLYDAIERANKANILFIAAAGNGGSDGVGDNNDSTPHYPSSYTNTNIIAVASITKTGTKSSFSNFGKTSVDIGAPGSAIMSTLPNNAYGSYNGTSMATPHVAGAAALYAAAHPGSSATTIKNAILSSATATSSMTNVTVTNGRLNVSGF